MSILQTLVECHEPRNDECPESHNDFEPFAIAIAKKCTSIENLPSILIKAMKKGMRVFSKFILESYPYTFFENASQVTPLHRACYYGWNDFIFSMLKTNKTLVDRLSMQTGLPKEISTEICSFSAYSIFHQDALGNTPLYYLIKKPKGNYLEPLQHILKLGNARVCLMPNHRGITPYDAAIIADQPDVVKCMRETIEASQTHESQ